MKKWIVLLVGTLLLAGAAAPATQAQLPYDTYIYSYWGEAKASPHATYPQAVVCPQGKDGKILDSPRDVTADSAGNLYIADTGNDRVLLLDRDMSCKGELKTFASPDNPQDTFHKPEGVFVRSNGDLYVADTENARIVVFDAGLTCKAVYPAPVSPLLGEDFDYKPISVAVDNIDRIYVVSKNNLLGIMAITPPGDFDGFIGVQKVVASPLDLLWRKFMTEEQIERTQKLIPTEFNTVATDSEGFIFATVKTIDSGAMAAAIQSRSKASDYAPVKKLNPSGVDVLTRNGFFPPAGDIDLRVGETAQYATSLIEDVAVCENGMYTLLDTRRNRLFTYDEDGNMLYAYGGTGNREGQFIGAVSIAYQGKNLIVLDRIAGTVTRFSLTEYGGMIDEAIALYRDKKYDESNRLWSQLTTYNNNLDIAYIGLGKSCLREKNYADAMRYFEKANDIEQYSKAFGELRREWISRWFIVVPVTAVLLIAAVVFLFRRLKRYNRKVDFLPGRKTFLQKLLYGFHCLLHPFEGFWEVKRRGRGSAGTATVILAAATLSYVLSRQYSGYVFSYENRHDFNAPAAAMTIVLPVLVWTVSNWSLTCLMDGEGALRDIYVTTCYSLLPLPLILLPLTAVSNLMVLEDAAFYQAFSALAFGWAFLLIFFGSMVIHNYTLPKNLATAVLALLVMLIIAFLAVLFGALIQRMASFAVTLYTEIAYRM